MIENSKQKRIHSYQEKEYWQNEMVLPIVVGLVYNGLNPVTRGILGLASAAGEQWFIVFIKKPWQFSLSGLFYWRYKPNKLAGVVWR
jgi:hypothetical protein